MGKSIKLTARKVSFWLEISIRTPQMQKHEHLTANFVCSIIQSMNIVQMRLFLGFYNILFLY